jgi:hypothetical protein
MGRRSIAWHRPQGTPRHPSTSESLARGPDQREASRFDVPASGIRSSTPHLMRGTPPRFEPRFAPDDGRRALYAAHLRFSALSPDEQSAVVQGLLDGRV